MNPLCLVRIPAAGRSRARARARTPVLAGLALLALLPGCDTVKETMGLTRRAPDEFAVVTKAPLVLPPDYALRPPQPGAPRPQELAAREQAQAALMRPRSEVAGQASPWLRDRPSAPAEGSTGESALLRAARASNADPNIRRLVNEEFTQLAERDKSFVDRLIFWQRPAQPGTVLDPARESERLREAAAAGQPPTTGETPSIQRRKRGILEGIF